MLVLLDGRTMLDNKGIATASHVVLVLANTYFAAVDSRPGVLVDIRTEMHSRRNTLWTVL